VVEWTRVVAPEDVEVLSPTPYPALTLVTCYPFYYVGHAPERFIVRARLVDRAQSAGGGATGSAGR
jgi:sortase A